MPTSLTVRRTLPPTVWLTRGRYAGATAEDVLRRSLRRLRDRQDIDDFLELPGPGDAGAPAGEGPARVFEARARVGEGGTVRARLSLAPATHDGQDWTLVAEADRPWDPAWPSPVGMFWPLEADAEWNHDPATGLRPGGLNPLAEDDKAVRRLLRTCVRDNWHIHVVVHEAMTTDGREVPLAHWLPPGLRHRVVEHRAAPHQLRVVNWALRESGAEVPRGGAVVLPGSPEPEGYATGGFSVRAVFLDGTEPGDLVDAVIRFAALPHPLPDGAEDALRALREDWHLLTLEEELAHERRLVKMYAEALEAMTRSRDLYREAAERAHEALAAFRESAEAAGSRRLPMPRPGLPLQHLTRTLERLRGTQRSRREALRAKPAAPVASSDGEAPSHGDAVPDAEASPVVEGAPCAEAAPDAEVPPHGETVPDAEAPAHRETVPDSEASPAVEGPPCPEAARDETRDTRSAASRH